MSYPTRYRRPPSRAAVATWTGAFPASRPVGTWYMPPKSPKFRVPHPAVWIGALLLADILANSGRNGDTAASAEYVDPTLPYDLGASGFTLMAQCGAPRTDLTAVHAANCGGWGGPPSMQRIINASTCLSGQAPPAPCVPGNFTGHVDVVGRYTDPGLGIERAQVLEYWYRAAPGAIIPSQPVVRARALPLVAVPGVSPARPLPIGLSPYLGAAWYPEESVRGYRFRRPGYPARLHPSVVAPITLWDRERDTVTKWVSAPVIPDVIPIRPDVERKAETQSRTGQLFLSWLKGLSLMGVASTMVDGLWRALPPEYQTPHARSYQKYRDVIQHYSEIDFRTAAENSMLNWLRYKAAAGMFGMATETLSHRAPNAGFGLYRAWATGERAYQTSPRSFTPQRVGDVVAGAPRSNYSARYERNQRRLREQAEAINRAYRDFRSGFGSGNRRLREAEFKRRLQRIRRYYDPRRYNPRRI